MNFIRTFILMVIVPIVLCEPRWLFQNEFSKENSSQPSNYQNVLALEEELLNRTDISNQNNASLYLSDEFENLSKILQINDTEVSGRSSRMLDLDKLLGVESQNQRIQGNREARILNDEDDGKPNLSIKGFIPIVGLGPEKETSEDRPSKFESEKEVQQPNPNHYSYSQQHFTSPQDQRFIGAALQNIAASISGQPNRKFGGGNEFGINQLNSYGSAGNFGDDCVCVPFYLCKSGYLESKAKNSNFLRDNQVAQSIVSHLTASPMRMGFSQHQQLQGIHQQQALGSQQNHEYLPIDERSLDKHVVNETYPQYVDEVFSRMLAGRSQGCGVLRTCCKVPSEDAPIAAYPPNFELNQFVNQENPIHSNMQGPPPFQPPAVLPPAFRPPFRPEIRPPFRPAIRPPPIDYSKPFLRPDQEPAASFIPAHVQTTQQIVGAGYSVSKPYNGPHSQYGYEEQKPIRSHIPLPIKPTFVEPPKYRPPHQKQIAAYPSNHRPYPPPSQHIESEGPRVYGTCGVRHSVGIHGRVQNLQYHETATEFGEFPWQVAILKKLGPADSLFVCGGTLISPLFIATAAHCIKNNQPHDLKVRLGEWDVHREDEFYPYVEKFVHEIIIHPEYFPGNLVNDIALIRMDSPVDLSVPHISPACLPEPFETFSGHRCLVTGWGKNAFGHQGEFQSVLKEVDLPVINHQECEHALRQTRLGPYYNLHPSMLCAGGEPGKDACEGDGGSPLVCEIHGVWKVSGLVSWGLGCGQPGIPGIYVNMAHLRPWIDNIVFRFPLPLPAPVQSPFGAGIIHERSNAQQTNSTQETREEVETTTKL